MMRLALIVLALVLAALGGCDRFRPPLVIHSTHLAAACGEPGQLPCATCASCHDGIRESEERALPTATDCARCHKGEPAQKVPVHEVDLGERGAIKFSHKKHLPMPGIRAQCMKCHPGVVDGTPEVLPGMPRCLPCHDQHLDRGECARCHAARDMARLVPKTFLRHDVNFVRSHAMLATQKQHICLQCHTQGQCSDCHDSTQTMGLHARRPDAIDREFIHRGDWLTRHPIEARSAPATCARCHATSSCEACHVQRGISAGAIGAPNPHPPGWVGPSTVSRDFHGRHAKREITACAACHDQGPATNCIRCHKVGGFGGNPHPDGWTSARSPNDAMCRYCHGS